jgi:hypothetical protein
MATDLTITLANQAGQLAALGEALGAAGINIDGVCGAAADGQDAIHILVEDAAAARSALESAGFTIAAQRDVLVLSADDRPGTLGAVARTIADAGVNIDLVYLAAGTKLVIGADDLSKAAAAVS